MKLKRSSIIHDAMQCNYDTKAKNKTKLQKKTKTNVQQLKVSLLYKGKQTPSTPRKRAKEAWSRGLVRISASWF